jgi:hypothetical protein
MKNWVIGAVSGGFAGLVGALLISEYNFSLLSVVLIGAVIGFCIGLLAKLIKRR